MTPRIQALDEAYKIVQKAIGWNDSATAISLLTRVEFYLLSQSRAELRAMMEGK